MAKIYVIITDGQHVLVGRGGRSGRRPAARQGLHLPGGTIDDGEPPRVAAVREVREEMGFTVDPDDITHTFGTNQTPGVTFVVIHVDSVAALVASHIRPAVTNAHDEPFEHVVALAVDQCWTNAGFSDAFYTDWFAIGLRAASDQNALQ